jgi:hypothetical protein
MPARRAANFLLHSADWQYQPGWRDFAGHCGVAAGGQLRDSIIVTDSIGWVRRIRFF